MKSVELQRRDLPVNREVLMARTITADNNAVVELVIIVNCITGDTHYRVAKYDDCALPLGLYTAAEVDVAIAIYNRVYNGEVGRKPC